MRNQASKFWYSLIIVLVRYLASGSGDTTVRFWDVNTETPHFTCKGKIVRTLLFSFYNADQFKLISYSWCKYLGSVIDYSPPILLSYTRFFTLSYTLFSMFFPSFLIFNQFGLQSCSENELAIKLPEQDAFVSIEERKPQFLLLGKLHLIFQHFPFGGILKEVLIL